MSETFGVSINEILSGKRLTAKEYKETAEENLMQTIKNNCFALQERIDFYRKKWLREHITVILMLGTFILALTVVGILSEKYMICYLGLIILVLAHCWRNNYMMSYVEKRAFDGTGK